MSDSDVVRIMTTIVTQTCRYAGVAEVCLLSTQRHASIVQWRNAVSYIANREYGLTLPKIGAFMSRDHTSVLHAIRSADGRIEADKEYRKRVQDITNRCRVFMLPQAAADDPYMVAIRAYRSLTRKQQRTFLAQIAAQEVAR